MFLSSDIFPESRQKCVNGHSTWIRVNVGIHSHRGQRPDLFNFSVEMSEQLLNKVRTDCNRRLHGFRQLVGPWEGL